MQLEKTLWGTKKENVSFELIIILKYSKLARICIYDTEYYPRQYNSMYYLLQ